jgi:hypothetical protein
MEFYGVLYRCRASLASSKNNRSRYGLLWLYGIYAVLHSLPQIAQVLLMNTCECRRLLFKA